ncbi:MAG: TPM domain-containing protein [Spirochaetaceae bacterium]|nr:TPM domain-containing protein [Spirochaetaceae bacterium]
MIRKRFVFAAVLILLTFTVPLASATQDLSTMPPVNLKPRLEAARQEETQQTFSKDKNGLYEWTGSFVVDAAGVLSSNERATLKDYLLKLNDETSVQIAVLTVPSTDGEPIHDFAVRQFEKWQLGQKGVDNGALLTVAWNDRTLDITTGDGTEGVLTDVMCGKIIRDVLTPAFREGKQGEGIISAVKNMAGIITQDDSLVSVSGTDAEEEETDESWLTLAIIIVIYIVVRLLKGKGNISSYHGIGSYRGGSSRSYGSSSRGSSSSFRSGGGGRTSGGGASGKW